MQSPGDLYQDLVRRIDRPDVSPDVRLDVPLDVAYVAPEAADRIWYPGRFMAPIDENEPRLTFALQRLAALSDDLAARGWPHDAQVLMGFSQGACLACEHVYRQRRRFGALVAFTGGLIGPPGLRWEVQDGQPGFCRGMPVLLGGSDDDPWVPASRMKETADVYRRLGARVDIRFFPGTGHMIHDAQVAAARALLAALPPRVTDPPGR
jgi:phospholipase/carboxylesterase